MSVGEALVARAKLHVHLMQPYEADESSLVFNVGRYLWEGFKQADGLLVVATPEHTSAFLDELRRHGADPEGAIRESNLITIDARDALARLMSDGNPSVESFDAVVGETVRRSLNIAKERGLRVYGELVGLLWTAKQFHSAIRVEQLWNRLRRSHAFSLFCGYPIDVFDKQFEKGALDALLSAHTRLIPLGPSGELEHAVQRAIGVCLGPGIAGMALSVRQHPGWAEVPKPEAAILWLRKNFPRKADEVLSLAREYYRVPA